MALINKIREKSGIAVGVLAIALLLFILGGDILSGNSATSNLLNGDSNKVGTIAGEDIDYQQFVSMVDAQRQQFEISNGRSASEQELASIREQIWEQLILDKAFEPEFQKLGIDVTADELRELLQGAKNMHPYIKQQFSDPATGMFNEAQHREFINAASNKTLPAEQQLVWNNLKSSLIKIRKSEKYQNLIAMSDYVTTAEAKKENFALNTKASADYLFVPFYSVNDTLVNIADSEINDYYSSHKEDFVGYDSRSFDYVAIQVVPTKEDSNALKNDITAFAKGLASAADPETYAASNSDVRTPYLYNKGELTDEVLNAIDNAIVGGLIGPIKNGNDYAIYKYDGTTNDTVATVRASHILIRPTAEDEASKIEAKIKATELLNQLKGGADFATLARVNGSDGTAQVGGDLGYFSNNGRMVKAFEDAVFAYNGTGLMPNLIETDFGYHIVKVTEPKSTLKYKLATIVKILEPSDATLNEAYQKAESIRANISSAEDLKKVVEEDNSLVLLSAERITPTATSFNTVQNAREVVQWAYGNDASVGDVADHVFVVDNTYIIAALTDASDANDPKAADFKDQIEAKLGNSKKGEIILNKLAKASGSFEDMAKSYGAGALVESVDSVSFQTGLLNSAGIDGIAIGKLFGMKTGTTSKPFEGQNGVFVMKKTAEAKAPEVADYTMYKESVTQRRGAYTSANLANQAVRDAAEIVDRRSKLF